MAKARIGPISKAIGENVGRIALARRLAVTELGRRTGMTRQSITEAISGRRRIDADELVALATALDVTVMQLLGLDRFSVEVVPGVTVTLARPVTLPLGPLETPNELTKEAQP